MWKKVGGKIRVLAIVCFSLLFLVWIIGAVLLVVSNGRIMGLNYSSSDQALIIAAAAVAVVFGFFFSWISTLGLYAFGQLVDDNEKTRAAVEELKDEVKSLGNTLQVISVSVQSAPAAAGGPAPEPAPAEEAAPVDEQVGRQKAAQHEILLDQITGNAPFDPEEFLSALAGLESVAEMFSYVTELNECQPGRLSEEIMKQLQGNVTMESVHGVGVGKQGFLRRLERYFQIAP